MKYETNDAPIQDHELGFGPSPAEKLIARNQAYDDSLIDDCDAAMTYDLKVGIKAAWVNPDYLERLKEKPTIGDIMENMKSLAALITGDGNE